MFTATLYLSIFWSSDFLSFAFINVVILVFLCPYECFYVSKDNYFEKQIVREPRHWCEIKIKVLD